MVMLHRWDPETSIRTAYSPKMPGEGESSSGYEKGEGFRRLSGFETYADYLKAYSSDPKAYGSGRYIDPAPSTSNIQDAQKYQEALNARRMGAFTEDEFNRARKGARIMTGEAMLDAAARAGQGVTDATKEYADKFGGGTQLLDYYKQLLMNPQEMLNTPEYAFLQQQMAENVRRTSPRLSGRRAIAAQERGGQLAATYRGQTLAERLAGAEQERMRGESVQGNALQAAKLQADLLMRPEEKRFDAFTALGQRYRT